MLYDAIRCYTMIFLKKINFLFYDDIRCCTMLYDDFLKKFNFLFYDDIRCCTMLYDDVFKKFNFLFYDDIRYCTMLYDVFNFWPNFVVFLGQFELHVQRLIPGAYHVRWDGDLEACTE